MTHILANVGDAGFTLPIALALAVWIATSRWQLALRWILTLGVGMCFVGATKIIHAGWGAEIEPIGFRMVSGHTMLATAILTVVLALLSDRLDLGKGLGIAAGLAIGAVTAAARVVDHSHSLAEVISGWIVGATVALLFLRAYARSDARPRFTRRLCARSSGRNSRASSDCHRCKTKGPALPGLSSLTDTTHDH
jgi:membrane-associated phospholipid phosphatase